MRYKLEGTVMPAVEMLLNRGESIYTQTGGMCWMSDGISMSTNARGGLMRGLGRMFSGESFFMTSYQAEMDGAMIAFSSTVPGEIVPVDLRGTEAFTARRGLSSVRKVQWRLKWHLQKKYLPVSLGVRGSSFRKCRAMAWSFWKWTAIKWRKNFCREK